jgi:hypothetical protein
VRFAEIDEGAWSTLYSTISRPFASPETGTIAVKVINHYGDEVLKVFDILCPGTKRHAPDLVASCSCPRAQSPRRSMPGHQA